MQLCDELNLSFFKKAVAQEHLNSMLVYRREKRDGH
jgi:hypothetical protein